MEPRTFHHRRTLCAWIYFALALIPLQGFAAGTCYQWRVTATNPWVESTSELDQQAKDLAATDQQKNSLVAGGNCGAMTTCPDGSTKQNTCVNLQASFTPTTFPAGNERATWDKVNGCTGAVTSTFKEWAVSTRTNPTGCPECSPQGTEQVLDGQSGNAPTSTCSEGCQYSRNGPFINFAVGTSGLSGYIGNYASTGMACSQTQTSNTNQSGGNSCKATSTDVICLAKNQATGAKCGTVNGEMVCPTSTKPGTCTSTSSGGVVCGADRPDGKTSTPPGPDTGTPGTPASPLVTVSDPTLGRDGNYYGPSVVAGSSTTQSGSGSGGSSAGSGSGSSSSSGSASSASSNQTCTGDCAPTFDELDEAPDFAATAAAFSAAVSNMPLIASARNVSASMPPGQCPRPSVTLWGHAITMDMHCTLFDSISGVLAAVMLAVWGFLGLRIILSA